MAVTPAQYALLVASLGIASFVLGLLAEHKKPPTGVAIPTKGLIICKYPSDPSVLFGYLSTALLVATSVAGYTSVFYPYRDKSVPRAAIFGSGWCASHLSAAICTTVFAAIFLLWPTIEEQLHHTRNVHRNLSSDCPTAKTGLLGGGAFVSLNASLFWLMSLLISNNVGEDYLEEDADKNRAVVV